MRSVQARAMAAGLSILAASCGLPRDPEKTSERVAATHELRVGFTDNPPWASGGPEPRGIEPDLVRAYAARLGARVLWRPGSETALVESLKKHELDVVIGGFEKKTKWSSVSGITQPFAKDSDGKAHVLLAAPGENRFILELDRFLTKRRRGA